MVKKLWKHISTWREIIAGNCLSTSNHHLEKQIICFSRNYQLKLICTSKTWVQNYGHIFCVGDSNVLIKYPGMDVESGREILKLDACRVPITGFPCTAIRKARTTRRDLSTGIFHISHDWFGKFPVIGLQQTAGSLWEFISCTHDNVSNFREFTIISPVW